MIKGYKKVWKCAEDGRVDIEISISSAFYGNQHKVELTEGFFFEEKELIHLGSACMDAGIKWRELTIQNSNEFSRLLAEVLKERTGFDLSEYKKR